MILQSGKPDSSYEEAQQLPVGVGLQKELLKLNTSKFFLLPSPGH